MSAVLETSKTANNILAQAFSDNLVLDYAGVPVASFSADQRQQLLGLIEFYIGNMRERICCGSTTKRTHIEAAWQK